MPRAVRHREVGGVGISAEGHAFDFDERRFSAMSSYVTCAQINQRADRRVDRREGAAGGEKRRDNFISAYPLMSPSLCPFTKVNRATVRCFFSRSITKDSRNLSQASRNSGRSTSSRSSLLGASTLTYSCVTGRSVQ